MMESRVPIRIVVVDDSTVMRSLLRITLANCPEVELVGMAADGVAGLEAIKRLEPDLVLLDIEMPCMNGLETLAEICRCNLTVKVIMCSTLTRRGASITLEALAHGAADYVAKPTAHHNVRDGMETLNRELLPKIRGLFSAGENVRRAGAIRAPVSVSAHTAVTKRAAVLAIGVSTGGPAALERFLPALPAGFPVPVLIVQHMPLLFTALLAERLDGLCKVRVREAVDAEAVVAGVVYLARGDWHMQTVGSSARCSLRLTQASPEHHCRPSVDVLFRSVATTYGAGALGVVLTGMGSDGLEGCRAIHAAGGRILVQDRETSAVWGMPGVVAAAGLADQVLALESIATEVVRSTSRYSVCKPA